MAISTASVSLYVRKYSTGQYCVRKSSSVVVCPNFIINDSNLFVYDTVRFVGSFVLS